MINLPEDLSGYARPDLIRWVAGNCTYLPFLSNRMDLRHAWLVNRFGRPRPGCLLHEATAGWIDYFDGDWQIMSDPFNFYSADKIIWFAHKEHITELNLAWS